MNARRLALTLICSLFAAIPAAVSVCADGVRDDEAAGSGLMVHWRTQIQADLSRDHVADVCLRVHNDQAVSWYEIRYSGTREVVRFDQLSARGIPLGKEGAEEYAAIRKEVLEAEGVENIEVELITTPVTSIYALSGFGDVHALDGESGKTRWKTRVGVPLHPAGGIAANDQYVVALKGSQLYCLNAANGHVEWSRQTRDAPGGGVAISGNFAYVTSVEGNLQMFPLANRGLPEK